jgi:hypothetical protein
VREVGPEVGRAVVAEEAVVSVGGVETVPTLKFK